MRDVRLSAHFMINEFIVSQEATRRGIYNEPSSSVIDNLRWTAENMELVWLTLGKPVLIVSGGGYRSARLNEAIGGSRNSDHLYGLAVDFIAPRYGSPHAICYALKDSAVRFNELILEFDQWVHISFPHGNNVARSDTFTRRGNQLLKGIVPLRRGDPSNPPEDKSDGDEPAAAA